MFGHHVRSKCEIGRTYSKFGKVTFIQINLSLYLYMFIAVTLTSSVLLPSDLVTQSVEQRRSNPKVVGSFPTLVRVFLCPCVGPFSSVGLTLTWFIWDRNIALHITLYSVNHIQNLVGQCPMTNCYFQLCHTLAIPDISKNAAQI